MSLPGNGIFVVKGEMSILMTAMKKGNRWSSHYTEDDQDTLIKSFQQLKEALNQTEDLKTLDPIVYLGPFLEVIKSEETTSPVTSFALTSVNKFLSYGLIDPTIPSIAFTVHSIADAVTHARFVETDKASDDVVLMKILYVLKTLTLSPLGVSLTNESLCDIMLSCFNFCFGNRFNELIRRTAEHYLRDVIQLIFTRLPLFPEGYTGNFKQLKMRPGGMEQNRNRKRNKESKNAKVEFKIQANDKDNDDSKNQGSSPPTSLQTTNQVQINSDQTYDSSPEAVDDNKDVLKMDNKEEIEDSETDKLITNEESTEIEKLPSQEPVKENLQGYVNDRGIHFTYQHPEEMALVPYGLPCVYELFSFLIGLCNPLDKQNNNFMIYLGLTLLTTAFEVGADSIGKYTSLLGLVKDDLCRNLFSLLNSERLPIFAANLQVSFLMFESLRTHLKFQLEFYLLKLIDIITTDSSKVTYEHKEVALDNILQLWRIPGFTTELYLNYDCNMYCINMYEELTKLLAKNAFPVTSGVYHTHLLSLDALLTVIESIEANCNEANDIKIKEANGKLGELDEKRKNNRKGAKRYSRMNVNDVIPTREELAAIKNIKKWLPTGTECFNHKPKKGIQFLQEHGVLKSELDPTEVCIFLRENPNLDKKMIGEYISGRSNLQVLDTFVKMFDFNDIRVDEALRLFLETFRLPGEAPLISLLLEHFAEHWHKCNGEPFANADAAFTLAYAIIMLNVDQHNHNVKKQNLPMRPEDFKKNLKKVNGGRDFDEEMLDEIYASIKNEEIIMPAEQTGIVRENYLWKVLLRRGASKDGTFTHVISSDYDIDLFTLIWGPIVAALSFVFDKSDDPVIYKKALQGFERCAFISSHFGMTSNLDMLIATISKYTTLHNQPKQNNMIVQFGVNSKAQCALKLVFTLTHQHGENIREGWKNLFDLVLTLYSLDLLPKCYVEAEDFIEPSGKIHLVHKEIQIEKPDTSLLSSLYSYMLSSENISKVPSPEEQELIDMAKSCIKDCGLEQVITDSKFLHQESLLDLIKTLIELSRGPDEEKSLGYLYNENVTVFFLELLIKIVLQNRDRVMTIWQLVHDHLYTLVMNATQFDYQILLERSVIGLLRLAIRLMRNEDMSPVVLQSLQMLLLLKSSTLYRISRQISYGLYELLKTSAQNIHTSTDWSIIFTLLECVGAGAQPPRPVAEELSTEQGAKSDGEAPGSSEEESLNTDRGYTSDSELTKSPKHSQSTLRSQSPIVVPGTPIGSPPNNSGGWILVGTEGEIQPVVGRTLPANQYSLALERNLGPHDPIGLVKCCESLAFLIRDVAHITPYNFDNCVYCIRTFVEASLQEVKNEKKVRDPRMRRKSVNKHQHRQESISRHRSPASSPDDSDIEDSPGAYHQITIQLLDLMHTLHTRTAQIFRWWAEESGEISQEISLWGQGWCPLLQGIARLCCDTRKQVRTTALTYLQRALLVHDLQTLTGPEWEACFNRVLFPLLNQLLQPMGSKDLSEMEETRMRAATLLSKVFLHHLTPLMCLATFSQLWLTILDFMDKYMHAGKSDLLAEAIPESLKNMLLVMESAAVFENPNQFWTITWDRLSKFLPQLREELFKDLKVNKSEEEPPPEFPKSTIQVTQHNIENATRSSIILQPPSSQHSINSPLFAHLGQMVSTPIGTSTDISTKTITTTEMSPGKIPQTPVETTTETGETHTFPVLCGNLNYAPATQPVPLYAEYLGNPYNLPVMDNTFQYFSASTPNFQHSPPTPEFNRSHSDIGNSNVPDVNQSVEDNVNIDNLINQNVFQSANYFGGDSTVPPGSEILFGSQIYNNNFNIPQTNTNVDTKTS